MKRLLYVIISLISFNLHAMTIHYEVSFPDAASHYVKIKMSIRDFNDDEVDVSMPVWTPGSYLVREYAQHVESIKVQNGASQPLEYYKFDKNTWRIFPGKATKIVVTYTLYCFDATVRTNFVDSDHATLIGANTFLYVEGGKHHPSVIEIRPDTSWKHIATTLPQKERSKWIREAPDYDFLVDNPIVVGKLKEYAFEAGGVPHRLAVFGENNADMPALVDDLQKICSEHIELFGENPCEEYLFILLNTENRYNGLEHMHCSLNQLPRWDFHPRDRYQRSMGLLSHEYFHLWNVKRIRPVELSKFDYNSEVYTRQLWVAEGLTSYYDDYVLYKSGVFNREEYLAAVAKMMNGVINNPGDSYQSITEASHDAWIKYYRRNENSNNNQVTYYDKGAMMVHALNFIIMHETRAEKSFDDVLRVLWAAYQERPDKGYTEEEFLAMVESVAGIDLDDFFQRHIYGTEPVDFAKYFGYAGLELADENEGSDKIHLGMSVKWESGKLMVKRLDRNYGAWKGGLNVNDEIIAIDGHRVNTKWQKIYGTKSSGQKITVLVDRQGLIRELTVPLTAENRVNYSIVETKKPGKLQKKIRDKWLAVQAN
jgi:predicted metalloprotease with PDZ domain